MNRTLFILLAITVSACTPETRNNANARSQFDIVREGVNMDERILACADNPQSVGFETSQECFADAQKLMADG